MSDPGTERTLVAAVERAGDGCWIVRSPGVGVWSGAPRAGELVGEASALGTLRQLKRVSVLRLGSGAAGRVVDEGPRPRVRPVEFGEALFRLAALREEDPGETIQAAGPAALAAGESAIVAPTDGVFYRKAAPDAPTLAEVGDRLHHAQPVGLIEVMKTFNQIVFEAGDPSAQAEVIEVRVADAAEVRAGDVLFVVRRS